MAARTVVTYVDDVDGKEVGPDGRSIAFSFDGVDYKIDLGAKNASKFEKAIGPYLDAATRVGGRKSHPKAPTARSGDGTQSHAIREWARANGYEIADRGRIPVSVVEAWKVAP